MIRYWNIVDGEAAAAFCSQPPSLLWAHCAPVVLTISVTALLTRSLFHSCGELWAVDRATCPGAPGVRETGQREGGSQGAHGGGAEARGGAATKRWGHQAAPRTGHFQTRDCLLWEEMRGKYYLSYILFYNPHNVTVTLIIKFCGSCWITFLGAACAQSHNARCSKNIKRLNFIKIRSFTYDQQNIDHMLVRNTPLNHIYFIQHDLKKPSSQLNTVSTGWTWVSISPSSSLCRIYFFFVSGGLVVHQTCATIGQTLEIHRSSLLTIITAEWKLQWWASVLKPITRFECCI